MYNQPDEEFDRLCRDAAENPEGHPSADGWDNLRRKLDQEMPEKPDRRPGWLMWLPFLISIPVAMFYWAQYPVSGKDLSSSLSSLKPVQQTGKLARMLRERLRSIEEHSQSPAQQTTSPTTTADAPGTPLAVSPLQTAPDSQAQIDESFNRELKGASYKAHVTTPPVRGDATESLVQTDQKASSVSGLAKSFAALPDSAKSVMGDSTAQGLPQEPALAPIANNEGIGFMAVLGPDFSNVHFDAGSKAGFSLGMLLEFHFNKRLSVQSGVIYEQKNYTAMGDAYGKIPGYDVNNPNFKMKKVDANCFMWEIPINLRYNFLAGKQHRVFAAGGFSTYHMRKEDLHYYYSYNNVNKYKNWMNDKSSAYWFAVANISVGYEYRMNQLFSVQAEPYFKIPVKGMGYGSVPINSMGILFGIRYRPLNGIDQRKK
jgi:hypothetical protein